MNNYEFLISERECGRLDEYIHRGLLSTKINRWLEVYQYHLEDKDARNKEQRTKNKEQRTKKEYAIHYQQQLHRGLQADTQNTKQERI